MAELHVCTICNDEAVDDQKCPDCRLAFYCSLECRQADEPIHKLLCASTSKFKINEDDRVRAIMFPTDGRKPCFTWLELDLTLNLEHQTVKSLMKLLSNHPLEFPRIQFQLLQHNYMRNQDIISRQIFMIWKENDEYEAQNGAIKAVLNKCKRSNVTNEAIAEWEREQKEKAIKTMVLPFTFRTAKKPEIKVPKPSLPRGTVIFATLNTRGLIHRDFRHIVDFLRLYQEPKASLPKQLWFRSHMVKGFRVNCTSDMEKYELPRHQIIYFPQDHPIFQSQFTLNDAIPQAIGGFGEFKIMDVPSVEEDDKYARADQFMMLMCLKPGSSLWGSTERLWNSQYEGSIQVANANREDLELSEVIRVIEFTMKRRSAIDSIDGRKKAKAREVLYNLKWKYFHKRLIEYEANAEKVAAESQDELEQPKGPKTVTLHYNGNLASQLVEKTMKATSPDLATPREGAAISEEDNEARSGAEEGSEGVGDDEKTDILSEDLDLSTETEDSEEYSNAEHQTSGINRTGGLEHSDLLDEDFDMQQESPDSDSEYTGEVDEEDMVSDSSNESESMDEED